LIEHRYSGWTDEYVKSIPFLRFEEIIETIVEARRDEEKQRLKEIAYGQWCAYHFIPLKKGSKHMSFKKFCDAMGLGKRVKPQWDEKTTEEISAATARIRERHGRSKRSLQDSCPNSNQCEDGDS